MAVHVLGPQRHAPATRGCNRPACMQATLRTRGQHRLPKQPSNTPDTEPHDLAARRWHAEMGLSGLPIPRLPVVRRLIYLPRCQQSSTARLHSAAEPTCGCQCRTSSTTKRDVYPGTYTGVNCPFEVRVKHVSTQRHGGCAGRHVQTSTEAHCDGELFWPTAGV